MQSSYVNFAQYYDQLTTDIEYEKWVDYLQEIFRREKKSPNLILDLACGTGTITNLLHTRGYDMIGIDKSIDMLSCAKNKNHSILYLNQDITNFELYGTVDAIICLLDSVNYLTDNNQIIKMFSLVNNYLNSGGLFIFDINTKYKFSEILADNIFVYDEDKIFYVWENHYCKEKDLCDFYLTFFIGEKGIYTRFDEHHIQRAYDVQEISDMLNNAGLKIISHLDCLSFNPPKNDSERIFFVAIK